MSRISGRIVVRAVAVGLLLVGVGGGAYLAQEGDRQQSERDAAEGATQLSAASAGAADQQRQDGEAAERADRRSREAEQAEAEAAEQRVSRAAEAAVRRAQDLPATGAAGPVPASCSDYGGNRATGCTLLLEWGFTLDQMPCLDNLWAKESGWNELAGNPGSGAYGIPQALPGNKMAAYGDDWETNPATQIKWGLSYIENRYSTPCGAWGHFQSSGWY